MTTDRSTEHLSVEMDEPTEAANLTIRLIPVSGWGKEHARLATLKLLVRLVAHSSEGGRRARLH